MLQLGIALGLLAGYALAVGLRARKDLQGAKAVMKGLRKKRNSGAFYAGMAVVTVVVALALHGTNQL